MEADVTKPINISHKSALASPITTSQYSASTDSNPLSERIQPPPRTTNIASNHGHSASLNFNNFSPPLYPSTLSPPLFPTVTHPNARTRIRYSTDSPDFTPVPSRPPSSGLNHTSSSPKPESKPASPFTRTVSNEPARTGTDSPFGGALPQPNAKPDPHRLLRLAPGIIKSRQGSVLSRGLCLKTDHYPSGRAMDLEFNLQGAPNFRSTLLNVYGCAQPTIIGLRTILALLNCRPLPLGNEPLGRAGWICTREEPLIYIGGRPFVLRDASHPISTYALSDRAENLEEIENRLKQDVLREAFKYGGLVLVLTEGNEGKFYPTFIVADDVRTVKEVFQDVRDEGYAVRYSRVPISSDQNSDYLDSFLHYIRELPRDCSLIFNCGMGAVRTTFAMCAGILIRRRQVLLQGESDPFRIAKRSNHAGTSASSTDLQALRSMEEALEEKARNAELLQLMYILENTLTITNQSAFIGVLMKHSSVLENLSSAISGKYEMILALLSCLEGGSGLKKVADAVIDKCDAVVNLRHEILNHRLRYVSTAEGESVKSHHLVKAAKALEKYFFLMAFTAYLDTLHEGLEGSFLKWLDSRPEIRGMIRRLRKPHTELWLFAPISDLSIIARGEAHQVTPGTLLAKDRFAEIIYEGGELVGDEWATQIVNQRKGITLRSGTILKRDTWHSAGGDETHNEIRGAYNFRRVPDHNIYALAQPSEDGIKGVLAQVHKDSNVRPYWVNLREEPLIYINSWPYVLREDAMSLRNIKSYQGINASRLELLEDRLKSDVLAELKAFDGRILLHAEQASGSVVPIWETVAPANVKTLREVMNSQSKTLTNGFDYIRIPLTAEKTPDNADVGELMDLLLKVDPYVTPIIVNCQLGRGRSTLTQVIIILVQQWLRAGAKRKTFADFVGEGKRASYQIINNLLRVVRNGKEVKAAVDTAITQCNEVVDLFNEIEDSRLTAEEAAQNGSTKPEEDATERGINLLRRYFFLCQFASYLNETDGENTRALRDVQSFKNFVAQRPVFQTLQNEFRTANLNALTPLGTSADTGEAPSDEAEEVVAKRAGRILSARTLLKSDFFSGLQKLSLPERVEGTPNFRRVRLDLSEKSDQPSTPLYEEPQVFGTGMPTVRGVETALKRMGAGPSGDRYVCWTSLREEPVIYINGRPHVLRFEHEPLENFVTTGITAETVESMERKLKKEVLREAKAYDGRILLHDEVEDGGKFVISASWEDVTGDSILTPNEVFANLVERGFKVDYDRLPVTDEQSPLPLIFDHLERRIINNLTAEDFRVFAFNCQMGRGRTTTGMVACALVYNILFVDAVEAEMSNSTSDLDGDMSSSMGNWGDADRDEEALRRGEYKLILQLVGVLRHGRLAKRLTDRAIDAMEGVQNLRKAILDYRIRAQSMDPGPKHEKGMNVAHSYLFRYGALITFAEYLIEKREAQEVHQEGIDPFSDWLRKRREITQVLSRRSLDDY